MGVAVVVLLATVGVVVTVALAVRMWRASRRGAPREVLLGYMALMVLASLVTSLAIRAL